MDDPEIVALLGAIDEQINSSETPYVKETFQELIRQDDINEEEARYMIAFCLADEIEKLEQENRTFDSNRYQTLLKLLPHLPE